MKGSVLRLSTFREIRGSLGRYLAIMGIIGLGTGFFSGIRITTPMMIHTIDEFYKEQNLYDIRVLSPLGWEDEDVVAFSGAEGVLAAEGSISLDVAFSRESTEDSYAIKVMTMPGQINKVILRGGRLPEKKNECLVDMSLSPLPEIGDRLVASQDDGDSGTIGLGEKILTVTGYADSPLYTNYERGNTSIGNGTLNGFIYVPRQAFKGTVFTEVYLDMDTPGEVYSDEYEDNLDAACKVIEDFAKEQADERYARIYEDTDVLFGFVSMVNVLLQLPELSDLAKLGDSDVYVLDRGTNLAYSSFESNAGIVEQIARVFPVFFILVAALVCATTMGRMVEEQRTMTGTLKALGYSEGDIMGRYLTYSGSAAFIGAVLGYLVGVNVFPRVIWEAYKMIYIDIEMRRIWSFSLSFFSLAASMLCAMGSTWLACKAQTSEAAAALMRPRAPKAGKRVILEYVTFIWKRLGFMHKISIRNIFRYKGRFLMMVVGIGGCMALLLTGFGIRDTVADFAEIQYVEIQFMDAQMAFRTGANGEVPDSLKELLDTETESYMLLHGETRDLVLKDQIVGINLMAVTDFDELSTYMDLHPAPGSRGIRAAVTKAMSHEQESGIVKAPGPGEAIICNGISEHYGVKKGDLITVRDEDMNEISLRVSGVFENLVYNYIFTGTDTLDKQTGEKTELNTAFLDFEDGSDPYEKYALFSEDRNVVNIMLMDDLRDRLRTMMKSLDYVVILVIFSAAGLAFIVLYNLTNINITERLREIATIKVLGFFRGETSLYVFRENAVLTVIGIIAGLFLGVELHSFVVSEIVVDMVTFRPRILPQSFLYSVVLTFVFNIAVDLVMEHKLEMINMAESLKSVE